MLRSYLHVASSAVASGIASVIVPAFEVPAGYRAHYGLTGALLAVFCTALSSISFLSCPRHPAWPKLLTLIIALPAYFFGVSATLTYALYGLRR